MITLCGKRLDEMGLDGKELSYAIDCVAKHVNTRTSYFFAADKDTTKLEDWFIRQVYRRSKFFRTMDEIIVRKTK